MKLKLVRIKPGAIVFQDHSFPHWGIHTGLGEENRLFKFTPMNTDHNRFDVRAWGYGLNETIHGKGAYGCGSLFVAAEDLIFVEEDDASVYEPNNPTREQVKRMPKRLGPDKGFENFMYRYHPLTQDDIARALARDSFDQLKRGIEDMLRVAYNSGYRRAKKNANIK